MIVEKAKNTRHSISKNAEMCPGIGSPRSKAQVVTATPSSPSTLHAPVRTMESPVMVQIRIVSIKVPVMETSPCRTGSLVLAAAAAIGAGQDPGLTEAQKSAADVNGDKTINASDAAVILIYAAAIGAGQDVKLSDFIK